MDKIASQLKETKKSLTVEEYKDWLDKKLIEHGINRVRLMAVVIVIERSLAFELSRSGSMRNKPYYRLYDDEGNPTKAWVHAAELALWLKYNGFKADSFVRGMVSHPVVRKFMADKNRKNQIPLNVLFPSARLGTDRLKDYSKHFKTWNIKH